MTHVKPIFSKKVLKPFKPKTVVVKEGRKPPKDYRGKKKLPRGRVAYT